MKKNNSSYNCNICIAFEIPRKSTPKIRILN